MARCLIAESASFGPPAPPPRGGLATPTTLLDLEGADSEGRTPLHVSAWQGLTDMAALLLDAGADVNATDKEKRTALQSASWQGPPAMVSKVSSAVLMPPSYRSHSPVGGQDVSPDSTSDLKRRSYISVGNQSSSKSSSNFTGSSTKSAQGVTLVQQPRMDLSFTQQLQRASKHRPLSQVLLLSPLSEPQSPIYASPPQSPLSDSSVRNSNSSPPKGERPTLANSTAINSPFPDTMPVSLAPLSFTQDSHMRIILGSRPTPLDNSAKSKRNGIATNPNLKTSANSVAGGIKVGLKNGFEAARKQVTAKCQATRSNGFPWKKETPL
ncbi:ankyrin repeat domain-containing protein 50-like [Cloeon dipterum]|uniref:ankyrin repeat domain-containing protein 50-like n=1 Tax=Cloeon dipterum TaxID=197152 RepID=UPI00321F9C68